MDLATTTIVLITGANQGIGLQIARVLSSPSLHPDTKHHVILGVRTLAKGEAAIASLLAEDATRSPDSLSTVVIDLVDDESIAAAAETVRERFGRIDVLINNAGIIVEPPSQTITTRAKMQETFSTNLFGTAAVTESFIPLLAVSQSLRPAHHPPRIIFLSSGLASLALKRTAIPRTSPTTTTTTNTNTTTTAAATITATATFTTTTGPRPTPAHPSSARHFPAYRCSKAALNMLMLHYAALYGPRGWRVNAVDPGLTDTGLGGATGGDEMRRIMESAGTVGDAAGEVCRLVGGGGGEGGVENGVFVGRNGVVPW